MLVKIKGKGYRRLIECTSVDIVTKEDMPRLKAIWGSMPEYDIQAVVTTLHATYAGRLPADVTCGSRRLVLRDGEAWEVEVWDNQGNKLSHVTSAEVVRRTRKV